MSEFSLPIHAKAPWLAPMAGWSDLSFRLLCREYGATVCCTEMISARGLVYEKNSLSRATRELLATAEKDQPLVVQLFGEDPNFMGEAVSILAEEGVRFFDCNMGCPVPKVNKTGAGAALLRQTAQAIAVAKAMLDSAARYKACVGFKLRLAWDAKNLQDTDNFTAFDLGRALEELGASWLTLHPRTATQGFSGLADLKALELFARTVSIPVIASGDLWTAEDAWQRIENCGATGVMFARGALRDPAIFSRYLSLYDKNILIATRPEEEAASVLYSRILRHVELLREYSCERMALLKMRTVIPRYVRHFADASLLRRDIISCSSWNDFYAALERFFTDIKA